MSTPEEAQKCIDNLSGIDLNGRKIRVDFSVTKRPHQSTPGEYSEWTGRLLQTKTMGLT